MPPAVASCKVIVALRHTFEGPVTGAGVPFTVTVLAADTEQRPTVLVAVMTLVVVVNTVVG